MPGKAGHVDGPCCASVTRKPDHQLRVRGWKVGSVGRSRAEEFKGTRERAGPSSVALRGTQGPSWGHGFVGLDMC